MNPTAKRDPFQYPLPASFPSFRHSTLSSFVRLSKESAQQDGDDSLPITAPRKEQHSPRGLIDHQAEDRCASLQNSYPYLPLVFSFVDPSELFQIQAVCRVWRDIIRSCPNAWAPGQDIDVLKNYFERPINRISDFLLHQTLLLRQNQEDQRTTMWRAPFGWKSSDAEEISIMMDRLRCMPLKTLSLGKCYSFQAPLLPFLLRGPARTTLSNLTLSGDFNFNHTQFAENDGKALMQFTNLEALDLDVPRIGTGFLERWAKEFQSRDKLRRLSFAGHLPALTFDALKVCRELTVLHLTPSSDPQGLDSLQGLSALRSLHLQSYLDGFHRLPPYLEELTLEDMSFESSGSATDHLQFHSHLRVLRLTDCELISGTVIQWTQSAPRLERVHINDCTHLDLNPLLRDWRITKPNLWQLSAFNSSTTALGEEVWQQWTGRDQKTKLSREQYGFLAARTQAGEHSIIFIRSPSEAEGRSGHGLAASRPHWTLPECSPLFRELTPEEKDQFRHIQETDQEFPIFQLDEPVRQQFEHFSRSHSQFTYTQIADFVLYDPTDWGASMFTFGAGYPSTLKLSRITFRYPSSLLGPSLLGPHRQPHPRPRTEFYVPTLLSQLCVDSCTNLNLLHLHKNRKLRCLEVHNLSSLQGIHIKGDASSLLKNLHISNCPNLDMDTLFPAKKPGPEESLPGTLNGIYIRDCPQVQDLHVERVAQRIYGLELLILQNALHLTDKSLAALASRCTHLYHLEVGGCRLLTDAGVKKFQDGKLEVLRARGTRITEESERILPHLFVFECDPSRLSRLRPRSRITPEALRHDSSLSCGTGGTKRKRKDQKGDLKASSGKRRKKGQ